MEVKDFYHYNGAKNLKPQLSQLFLNQIDFFQKTDWLSFVLLYMWVEYERKWSYFRA